jgi:hypothetical protein
VSDDDYEERMKSRQPQNQLDDIRDWQSGNKSMAEEAIDKVKEFVSKVKFFDSPDDYPYVLLFRLLCKRRLLELLPVIHHVIRRVLGVVQMQTSSRRKSECQVF